MCDIFIPLCLPASLHTKDRVAFVGLGWKNISNKVCAATPELENKFLNGML